MVDMARLKAKIDESGMTIPVIAERANLKDYTLRRKLEGNGDNFTAKEIAGLSEALHLKVAERNKIFF